MIDSSSAHFGKITLNKKSMYSTWFLPLGYHSLGDHSGLLAPCEFLQLGHLQRSLDDGLQGLLRIEKHLGLVILVLLDVEPDGGARRPGSRQSEDDPGPVREHNADSLLARDAPVDWVGILKVVRLGHSEGSHLASLSRARDDGSPEVLHHLVCAVRVAALVVIPAKVVPAVLVPVLHRNVLHGDEVSGSLVLLGQNAQPGKDGPDPVLLPDVVASSAEALLAANAALAGIHEVAEELPAGWGLEEGNPELGGHEVQGAAGRHAAGHALEAVLEVRDALLGVRGDHGHRVRGGDEEVLAQDHVPVPVSVTRGAEVILPALVEHQRDELLGVGQVGVGVPAPKVLLRHAVLQAVLAAAQRLHEDRLGVSPRHGVQRVEHEAELRAGQELPQHVKVKDLLQQLEVVIDGGDHLDGEGVPVLDLPDGGQVDVGHVRARQDLADGLGLLVDLVGDLLGRGLPRVVVELDAPVLLRPARVVARAHDEASVQSPLPDDGGGRGGGENGVLADVHLLQAVRRGDLDDDLGCLLVEPAAVASEHDALPLDLVAEGVKEGLHPVRKVVPGGEDLGLLPQARGPGLLALNGLRGHGRNLRGVHDHCSRCAEVAPTEV
mmetsp:Transcript_8188/g.28125  ORF Transcript_8188/g.28125 Transcript_8188/m.28125 type:complete len:607 (-) Transcript_8188:332-2152(-)